MGKFFYTPKEVAKLLGVAPKTVYNYIYSQKLPARRWGGRWVVLEEDLKKFFSELPINGKR